MMARARLEQALRSIWQHRGPAAWALWPLAQLYRTAIARQMARPSPSATRLSVPVIVVGNVVAGGAGKTPTTLAVVQHLQARGWQPAVVSRGYGRRSDQVAEVTARADPAQVGDEPLLLQQRSGVPVFVGRQRAQAAQALLQAHPQVDIVVCDDGLQHRALARDVEICVFDAGGIGNGWLLPAGPLRDVWPQAVDLVLITEATGHTALPAWAQAPAASVHQGGRALAEHAITARGEHVPLASLAHKPLTALAAIARPQAFFDMLRRVGLTLEQTVALADHDPLTHLPPAAQHAATLVCTEKDAVKLWRQRPDALAVPLQLNIPDAFWQALDLLLEAVLAKRRAIDRKLQG